MASVGRELLEVAFNLGNLNWSQCVDLGLDFICQPFLPLLYVEATSLGERLAPKSVKGEVCYRPWESAWIYLSQILRALLGFSQANVSELTLIFLPCFCSWRSRIPAAFLQIGS